MDIPEIPSNVNRLRILIKRQRLSEWILRKWNLFYFKETQMWKYRKVDNKNMKRDTDCKH